MIDRLDCTFPISKISLLDDKGHKGENQRVFESPAREGLMSRRMALLPKMFLIAALATTGVDAVTLKIVGFDDMSCHAWVLSKDDAEQRRVYLAWIRGVVTGHNYARLKQQVSAISENTVENFVDRYCVEKPNGQFSDAALRMTDRFSGRDEAITR